MLISLTTKLATAGENAGRAAFATFSAALVFWGHLSSNGPATSPRPSTETNTTGKVLGPHDGESACDQHSAEDQQCLRSKLQRNAGGWEGRCLLDVLALRDDRVRRRDDSCGDLGCVGHELGDVPSGGESAPAPRHLSALGMVSAWQPQEPSPQVFRLWAFEWPGIPHPLIVCDKPRVRPDRSASSDMRFTP